MLCDTSFSITKYYFTKQYARKILLIYNLSWKFSLESLC